MSRRPLRRGGGGGGAEERRAGDRRAGAEGREELLEGREWLKGRRLVSITRDALKGADKYGRGALGAIELALVWVHNPCSAQILLSEKVLFVTVERKVVFSLHTQGFPIAQRRCDLCY